MNILHLLSQNHLTGAEVYAATLAQQQISAKNRVYQVSNGFYYPSEAVRFQLNVETRSKFDFCRNVLWLRNLLRKENIHVVHCHSRAAAKLGYWATLGTQTALISTVHGVQHSSFSKKLFNQYGRFIIAVCENVKAQLVRDFSYSPGRIKVYPNPISSETYRFMPTKTISAVKKIAVVGRSTGPKKERTEQVLKALCGSGFAGLKFEVFVIGGTLDEMNLPAEVKSRITELHINNLNSEIYAGYDLIIGSGRVSMESLVTGIPTIAFGEACYCGLVTAETFSTALVSNFGDIHPDSKSPVLPESRFADDVMAALANPPPPEPLSQMASSEFSLEKISAQVQRLYESALFLKNYSKWIPVLMYHKVPDQPIQSQHKIFVTKDRFEKHLKFFQQHGFTTLSFADIAAFRKGEKPFSEFPKKPLVISFDDGYRDNLVNASPLLKKYGFKAQLFLLASPEISSNNWDTSSGEPMHEIVSGSDRQQWLGSAFEIGSHGFSHKKITALSKDEALNELRASKTALEKEFQRPVHAYAFTYGITADNSARLAEQVGYDYAVNTDTGGLLMEEEPFAVFRVNIFPDENYVSLLKKTSRWYRKYYYFKRKK